jgi:hypothetical protein
MCRAHMRSAKRTAKLSIGLGAVNSGENSHQALESPLAERAGGWPARSAVLTSSLNQGKQGGLSPQPNAHKPALFLFLGAFLTTGFLWWVIFSVCRVIFRLAQY